MIRRAVVSIGMWHPVGQSPPFQSWNLTQGCRVWECVMSWSRNLMPSSNNLRDDFLGLLQSLTLILPHQLSCSFVLSDGSRQIVSIRAWTPRSKFCSRLEVTSIPTSMIEIATTFWTERPQTFHRTHGIMRARGRHRPRSHDLVLDKLCDARILPKAAIKLPGHCGICRNAIRARSRNGSLIQPKLLLGRFTAHPASFRKRHVLQIWSLIRTWSWH